jgi:hypothetical protein
MSIFSAPPAAPPEKESEAESVAVHAWRVSQLVRLGLAPQVADAVADKVDWHEIHRLVSRGCPASLAVAIVH